jgi:hypothetical protein
MPNGASVRGVMAVGAAETAAAKLRAKKDFMFDKERLRSK